MAVKYTQPRANPPYCWACDRLLHAGGRAYTLVEVLGVGQKPMHKWCAKNGGKPPAGDERDGEGG